MLDFPKRRVDFSWLQITAKMKLMTRRWRGARPWRSWGGAERNCGWNRESRDNTHFNGECGHLYPVLPDPTHLCSATSCLRSLFSSPIWLWPGEATHSDLLSRKRVNDSLPPPPQTNKKLLRQICHGHFENMISATNSSVVSSSDMGGRGGGYAVYLGA